MRHLQGLHRNVKLVVLVDGEQSIDNLFGVENVCVPASFAPSRAKYKARALEYFRLVKGLDDQDWTLHLDEETIVDEHCLSACIDFIKHETMFDYGQGLIAYNSVNYWKDSVLTFADILRFRDDLGRFQFQYGKVHAPLFGCHGSFLLTRGNVENAATWNTDCLAEDFWFSLEVIVQSSIPMGT